MAIDQLPLPAPNRGMPDEEFSPAVDAWLGAIPRLIDQINAAVAAMNFNAVTAIANEYMTVSAGEKTFTTETNKSFVKGHTVKLTSISNANFWMLGDVLSYSPATGAMTVNVQFTQNPGPTQILQWQISLAAPAPVTIPIGSTTVWYQAAAPVGWAQVTAHNNKSLRIVSGVGGGGGGSVTFTDAFKSQGVSGSVNATTITAAQMPAHQHSVTGYGTNQAGAANFTYWSAADAGARTLYSSWEGGSGSHSHGFSGTAINLAVQYIDMILATKT